MEDKQKAKPELSLVQPGRLDDLMALVEKVSGRKPTPEEREYARVKLAQAGLLQPPFPRP
jgi:hypothetical protein